MLKKKKGNLATERRQGEVLTQNGTTRWDLYSKPVLSPDNTCGPVFLNDVTKPPTHAEDSQLALERGGVGEEPVLLATLRALTWPSL